MALYCSIAALTASVTARLVIVAPVSASTPPASGVLFFTSVIPFSGTACLYWSVNEARSAFAPRPGVSSWLRITTPVMLPAVSMPVMTCTVPP